MIEPNTLQKYALFGGLLEDQIENLIPLMVHEEFGPDITIITEGEPNDKVYFILDGQVSINRNEKELSKFREGDTFGEMEVIDVMPAIASVKTITPVTVISMSNKALRAVYNIDVRTFSLIIMNLARDLSRRLRKMDETITSPSILNKFWSKNDLQP